MQSKKNEPEFMIIYHCANCEQDSGFTEKETPVCRTCQRKDALTIISKQKITAEVMAARLKEVTDNMFRNLELAFQSMTDDDKAALSIDGQDPEQQMLELLAKVQQFREDVQKLELKNPGEEQIENSGG